MNILDFKRKALGYTFRIEGDFGAEADSPGTGTGTGTGTGEADSQAAREASTSTAGYTPGNIGAKPGESAMAQAASQNAGMDYAGRAARGELDVSAENTARAARGEVDTSMLTAQDIENMVELGLGSITGVNKANPEQTVQEIANSFAASSFIEANMPSIGTLAAMVAGPLAGIVVNSAMSLASGKSLTDVIGSVVGGMLGQAITSATGIPVSLDTLAALVEGKVGQAALSVALMGFQKLLDFRHHKCNRR